MGEQVACQMRRVSLFDGEARASCVSNSKVKEKVSEFVTGARLQ